MLGGYAFPMVHHPLVQFAPFLLAAFGVTTTLLFFLYGSRRGVAPVRFWLAHTLWYVLTFFAGIAFALWVVPTVLRTDEGVSRMLVLLVLGLVSPVFGTFGLVAWGWPAVWQRFVLARDAGQQYYRGRLGRTSGHPPAA